MKRSDLFIKLIVTIVSLLFGITFIFSGFVKAVDPLGFTYKIEDYLISFQLTQFIPLALSFAVILIVIEVTLGVLTILGIYRKWTSFFAVLFMVVMTPLTLYIAVANPVKDCGCFGDALIISNWNTFYKNIVLLTFAIVLFVKRRHISPFYTKKTKPYVLVYVVLFFVTICLYSLIYLPIIDFRPYHVGSDLKDKIAEDMTQGDVYENIYVYEKEGNEKEFTEENYPWEDSTWTFVELKSKLIEEGDKPEIQDFTIIAYQKDSNGLFEKTDNITEDILSQPLSLLLVSLSLDDISESKIRHIQSLAKYAATNSIDMHIVTASDENAIGIFDRKMGDKRLNYASMDELTLKTIIRSNPGVVLLKEGVVQAKWSKNRIPDEAKLHKIISKHQIGLKDMPNNNSALKLLIICLMFIIPLIGIKWYDRDIFNSQDIKQYIQNK